MYYTGCLAGPLSGAAFQIFGQFGWGFIGAVDFLEIFILSTRHFCEKNSGTDEIPKKKCFFDWSEHLFVVRLSVILQILDSEYELFDYGCENICQLREPLEKLRGWFKIHLKRFQTASWCSESLTSL